MDEFGSGLQGFWQENKVLSLLAGVGLVMVLSGGIWWWENREPVEVEIVSSESEASKETIWVDVQGAVQKPGVYELNGEARLKDVLLAAGGLSTEADRSFVARYVNLASKVSDGLKIYIPKEGEKVEAASTNTLGVSTSTGSQESIGKININSATSGQLEKLWGIGASRAKAIIEARPYTSIDELVSKKIIPDNVFERIKDQIVVY